MQCPVDNTTLVMSDRQGIEIDYCPQCRGVWLDRGELDKLIERSSGSAPAASHQPQAAPQPQHYQERGHTKQYDDDDDDHHRGGSHHGRKHKESWLSDIFD